MIRTFIRRPVFTTMLVMLLVVFGGSSYPSLGIDLNPDIELPIVTVLITYTGASPEEMESLITKPVEDAVSSVAGIKTLSSISREGFSQTTLEFELGTNPKMAANDVREKVSGVRKKLPEMIDEPVTQRFDITAQAVLNFSLASATRERGEIRKIAVDVVKDELQRIEGVAEVNIYSAADREIFIYVDPRKLEAYNLPLQPIYDLVNAQNYNTPGGRVNSNGNEMTVRTTGRYKSIDDIKELVVANQQGRVIRMGDVASVMDGWGEERTYARTKGVPSVMVSVQKQSGTNTVNVAEKVKAAMLKLEKDVLPADIKVSTVRDNSVYIRDNVDDVMVSLIFGGLLAVLITFLFLRDGRATIIAGIAIPTSIIATFFLMKSMNFTLNNMSLLGLSLAVGILIDDAIVVIENIVRHMDEGASPMEAAAEGTTEISLAVLATTFSLLAVFVPVGTMGDIIGQFFKQFGLTVAFAVAFSLFVAFTLVPTMSAYWLRKVERPVKTTSWFGAGVERVLDKWEAGFERLRHAYEQGLRWALFRPKKLMAAALLSLFLNFLLVPIVGFEFQPTYDSGEFSIAMSAPAGTSMEKMKELVAPVEKEILAVKEVDTAFLIIGGSRQPPYKASMGVKLLSSSDRKRTMSQIQDDLRVRLRNTTGLKVAVQTGQNTSRGDARPLQLAIRGPELTQLTQYAQTLAENIKAVPGTADVDFSSEQYEPQIVIKFDPARAGEVGIDATSTGNVIQMAFLGIVTKNKYSVGDSSYDIRVQMPAESRRDINDVANLRVSTKTGAFVRLGDVAEVKLSSGPTQIDREDRQRQVIVYSNAVGISTGDLMQKVDAMMPALNLPLGYSYKFIGQAKQMTDAFGEIVKALIMAIILIYMVLAAQFESYIHPLTIMLSLPFSFIGSILGLLVGGHTINIMSMIGIIMLMGLVTKNAILLVDYANQLRDEGENVVEALIKAGSVRLRPILMTTLAMILGMMPLALGIGAGAELRAPMAVAVIGGLITSTLLTMVIVPLAYYLIDRFQIGLKHKKMSKIHPE
ncbi:MAG TPA: efflux RND transporter permease subunit [Negativicutes bacterium]|nr:efflux RND transporter permease subunit [Negativicutes bacterium]